MRPETAPCRGELLEPTAIRNDHTCLSGPIQKMCRNSAAAIVALCVVGTASAQDLHSLSRLVAPAYIAMSLANLCSMEPGWPQRQPRGFRGVAVHYAEHVKNEVIASLSYADAVAVLTAAAGAARDEARARLRTMVTAADEAEEAERFRAWCDGDVSFFVADMMATHDADHETFLHRLATVKESLPEVAK